MTRTTAPISHFQMRNRVTFLSVAHSIGLRSILLTPSHSVECTQELVERGFEKLINDVDGKSAAQQKVREAVLGCLVFGMRFVAMQSLKFFLPRTHSCSACCTQPFKFALVHHFLETQASIQGMMVMSPFHSSQVGEQSRPLTMAAIEEFCRDFGLDPEFSMHSNIRGLSGGQKVRACSPHSAQFVVR